ncbi:MAG: class I SAM-dependent methyltransferase [Thermoplasmata archaeon]|nr:class I SAM-dependent methyltransferase [Thermoplasmata archaeon]
MGSGPGRFLRHVGRPHAERVALDLSPEMLLQVERTGPNSPHLVRGDGGAPPFCRAGFAEVAVLGNALGFSGDVAEDFLVTVSDLVAPGGFLLLEVVAGAGERSRYLTRLPPGAVARLLRAPVAALVPRVAREGYVAEPRRRKEEGTFCRFDPKKLGASFLAKGWGLRETLAIAPALGADPESLEAVRPDAKAWDHLLEFEELVGRQPERWPRAAAVLLALARPASEGHD